MDSINQYEPYFLQLLDLAREAYHHSYFQQTVVVITVVLFFLVGRISYEKKLSTLLDLVNDADQTRQEFSAKLSETTASLRKAKAKKPFLIGVSLFCIFANVAYFYITNIIDMHLIGGSMATLVLLWGFYTLVVEYLKWSKANLEQKVRSISITAQTQIKEILKIFGPSLTNEMKILYETDLSQKWQKEAKQQCKLAQCRRQKDAYRELYALYEDIIDQIKQINMCEVCLNQKNISVQQLGAHELETILKNCKRAMGGGLSLEQKKQIVNRLLLEYQKMIDKLPYVCKKGCCIKQRTLIEATKVKYHDKLKKAMSNLNH